MLKYSQKPIDQAKELKEAVEIEKFRNLNKEDEFQLKDGYWWAIG